jgi:uncharacterized cupin superfamily protein
MSLMLSNGLLAASLLLGQPGSPPEQLPPLPPLPATQGEKIIVVQNTVPAPPTLQPPQPTQPTPRPILGFFRSEDRPILTKIQGWFKRDDQPQQPQQPQQPRGGTVIRESAPPPILNPTPAPATSPPVTDFPRRMPNPSSKATTPADPVAKETAPAKEIQQTSLQQIAVPKGGKSPILPELANKIGRDEKFEWITGQFEIENGNFVLYYATPETVDKYHGRIILLPEKTDLKQYRRGDLVSVRGQVSQRQTMQGMVPIYHVSLASLIDRPKQ